jgi:hypothetical protein
MKFTKEDAYKELVAKMTAKGETLNLSERSINELLENLMTLIANEETELTDFVDKVMPMCKTADSNIRHDVSVGISEFKKTFTPPSVDDKKKDVKDDPNKELLDRLASMEAKWWENEAKEKVALLKKEFASKAKEKGVKNDEWLSDYMNEISIGDDFDVDAKVESCLKFYNKSVAAVRTDKTPGGGGGSDDKRIKDVIAAAVAMKKAAE